MCSTLQTEKADLEEQLVNANLALHELREQMGKQQAVVVSFSVSFLY